MEYNEQNNEIIAPQFDLIENEEDKNALVNNLDNFDIFKINDSKLNNTDNGINIGNFFDGIVKVGNELFKNGLILRESSKLFKCDTSIKSLMEFTTGGYGSAIVDKGKIVGQANFFPVGGDMTKLVSPFLVLQIASVALGQYFMYQINEKLGELLDIVKLISMKFECEKMAELKTIISEIDEVKNKETIDKKDINKLDNLKKETKDILHYYELKIESSKIEEINFGDKKRFKYRIEKLLQNIGEFDLNYYMYKKSYEVLISIYALLYYAYIQNNDFKQADKIFDILKGYNKLFNDEIYSKLKSITDKILEQFHYIQENKNWIPNLMQFLPLPLLAPIPPVVHYKIFKKIKSSPDFTKEYIEKYNKLKEEIDNNSSQVIEKNKNFIQNINRKNTIYYAEINSEKYALIEKNNIDNKEFKQSLKYNDKEYIKRITMVGLKKLKIFLRNIGENQMR